MSNDPPAIAPVHIALRRSIECVVQWASDNAEMILEQPAPLRHGDNVAVACRYMASDLPCYMVMRPVQGGEVRSARLPGEYMPFVAVTGRVRVPRAYAVPRTCGSVLDLLRKHRFFSVSSSRFKGSTVETYRLLHPCARDAPFDGDEYIPPPVYARESTPRQMDDFVFFPTEQEGARTLVLLLEPESQFRPAVLDEFALADSRDTAYPIGRIA
jgi:hypothetical protein